MFYKIKKNWYQAIKMTIRIASVSLLIAASQGAHAYTAIATVEGHVSDAWASSYSYSTQKEADKNAIESCQKDAKEHGIPHLAKQCKVVTRAKGPGYGAVTCGDGGCQWTTGYSTVQEAVDAAYDGCAKSFTNCKDKNITYWEDFAGFTPTQPQNTANNDCRPRSTHLRCSSSCSNGDCIVTYENGCKMRVQIQPRFNGFTNTWEYPSPNC